VKLLEVAERLVCAVRALTLFDWEPKISTLPAKKREQEFQYIMHQVAPTFEPD
jgi:hypothetical protein